MNFHDEFWSISTYIFKTSPSNANRTYILRTLFLMLKSLGLTEKYHKLSRHKLGVGILGDFQGGCFFFFNSVHNIIIT